MSISLENGNRPDFIQNGALTDQNSTKEIFSQAIEAVGQLPVVARANWRNPERIVIPANRPFTLAAEFCPLYLPGDLDKSQLDQNPSGEGSILDSRVGNKWAATTAVVSTLASQLRNFDIELKLQATFGDVGVLVTTPEEADEAIVARHATVYHEALTELCAQEDVELDYHLLSEIEGPDSYNQRVDPFIITSSSTVYNEVPRIDELLDMLDMQVDFQSNRERKKAQVLPKMFTLCQGNVDLWRGLVNTYIHYVGEIGPKSDIHLGMERARLLLSLQAFPRGTALEQMPALNIEVA